MSVGGGVCRWVWVGVSVGGWVGGSVGVGVGVCVHFQQNE